MTKPRMRGGILPSAEARIESRHRDQRRPTKTRAIPTTAITSGAIPPRRLIADIVAMRTPSAPITVKLQCRTNAEKKRESAPSRPMIVKPGTVFGTSGDDSDAREDEPREVRPGGVVAPSGDVEREPDGDPGKPDRQNEAACLTSAQIVDSAAEHDLRQVDGQQSGRGGHRHEEERVGTEREQQERSGQPDDCDRRQPDMNAAEVACTFGPDVDQVENRVRREADPTDRHGLEHVGGLGQVTAAEDLTRAQRAGQVDECERENACRAQAVPVDDEERHRRGHDEQEAEVDGDDRAEAELSLRRACLLRLCACSRRLQGCELVPEAVDLGVVVPVRCKPVLELVQRDVDVGAITRVGGDSVTMAHLTRLGRSLTHSQPRRASWRIGVSCTSPAAFPLLERGAEAGGAILRPVRM